MSFMHITCPWCGTGYTFGIVGRQQIGSGHRCKAVVLCETDGCSQRGIYSVVDLGGARRFSFSCAEHIGDRALAMCQTPDAPEPGAAA